MVHLQLKDHLELFMKSREFLTNSRLLSRHDMTKAVESNEEAHPFLGNENEIFSKLTTHFKISCKFMLCVIKFVFKYLSFFPESALRS